jgi:adenylate cyclase, class 1
MMGIDIDVGHAADAMQGTQALDHHTAVIEDTETRGAITAGVMQPANGQEGRLGLAGTELLHGRKCAARDSGCGPVDPGPGRCVAAIEGTVTNGIEGLHPFHMGLGMEAGEFLRRGRDRLTSPHLRQDRPRCRLIQKPLLAGWPEGVAVRKAIGAEFWTGIDEETWRARRVHRGRLPWLLHRGRGGHFRAGLKMDCGNADTPPAMTVATTAAPAVQDGLRPAERFALVNRERLRRLRDLLPPRQRDVLDIMPYLFHTNHEQLPGFVDDQVPMGINGYTPEGPALSAAVRLARGHRFARRALQRFEVLGLYLMGSSGSIAQTPTSDLDIWVCHPAVITPDRRQLLAQKARAIEVWADEMGVEVHFFVFAPEEFAAGQMTALSEESSGSSQQALLLDEFYRSGLVLAGQYPRWVYEPPSSEPPPLKPRTGIAGIDFGSLSHIPAKEFFGAAIWQVYKSLGSPYKSVLKLLLMEAYAAEFPDFDLLSQQYKRAVLSGTTDLDTLDPYLLMYRKVERYLLERGDHARLELARRCLYLKVEEPLSRSAETREIGWRRVTMQKLTRDWGWDSSQLASLDSQNKWRFHAVQDEGRTLVAAITTSYRAISEFARRQGDALHITQSDLNTLGRKLYAAFERRPGKIELINRGIAASLVEERITLHVQGVMGAEARWLTYLERVLPEDTGSVSPARRGPSMVDALIWCYLNRLIARGTVIAVNAPGNHVGAREAHQILQVAEQLYPGNALNEPTTRDLERPSALIAAAVFVNVGIDPLTTKIGEGQHLTTGRSNALTFGGLHDNLLQTFDFVLSTSWGEAYVHRFHGPRGIAEFLIEYLGWMVRAPGCVLPSVHVVGGRYASTIQRRLQLALQDFHNCFAEAQDFRQFVLEAGQEFFVFRVDGDNPGYEVAESFAGLVALLARPRRRFTRTFLDSQSLTESALSLVLAANRPGVIQVVLDGVGSEYDIFVVDEVGGVFHQHVVADDRHALLEHLQRFFRAITRRRALANSQSPIAVETYCVREENPGERRLSRLEDFRFEAERPYVELKVMVNLQGQVDGQTRRSYTILCGNQEFGSLEHGPRLFQVVAESVKLMRRPGSRHPVYITDVELVGGKAGSVAGNAGQTCQLLQYKRMLEEHLSKFL